MILPTNVAGNAKEKSAPPSNPAVSNSVQILNGELITVVLCEHIPDTLITLMDSLLIRQFVKLLLAISDNQPAHFYDIKKEGNPAVLCQEKTSKNEWWYVAASEKQHQRAIYNHPSQNLSMQSLCQQSTCLN